jgi:hypothetical protein
VLYGIINSGDVQVGGSKNSIIGAVFNSIMGTVKRRTPALVNYTFNFLLDETVLMMYLIVLPLFVFCLTAAYAFSLHKTVNATTADEEKQSNVKLISAYTLHYFFFYLFVFFIFGILMYSLIQKFSGNMKPVSAIK